MIFDLHTHTSLSVCSCIAVDDIIDAAKAKGLDGICITDHQTMDIRHYITEGLQPNGLIVIFGMEYETPEGDFLIFGPYEHILDNMNAEPLLNHIRNTQGAAIAAHPFREERPVNERLIQNGLFTIAESINGRNSDIENLRFRKWRDRYPLTETAGSDAHTPEELGRAFTRFPKPIYSRQALISALNTGLCRPEAHPQLKPMAL